MFDNNPSMQIGWFCPMCRSIISPYMWNCPQCAEAMHNHDTVLTEPDPAADKET